MEVPATEAAWMKTKSVDKEFSEVWARLYDLGRELEMLREQLWMLRSRVEAVDNGG